MTKEPTGFSSREERLNEILAEYFQAVEAGHPPDVQTFISHHPGYAAELAEFFAQKEGFEQAAEQLKPPETAPTLPVEPATQAYIPDEPTRIVDSDGDDVPTPGTKVRYFGDYELLEEIARGGMGVVYKARQTSLNRIVALKMILAGQLASEEDVKRFRTEAEAAANLQHPNIVAIHEVGEHEGQHYFSMDYVEGRSLAEIVRENPLPARKAAEYVKTIAEAIHYAHEQGTLHRDLKPSNVLIDANDGPHITDFGLAKRIERESELTASGAVLGTPSYMPPEQAAGKRGEVGPASDVYSIGAILYELLTGRPPFRAETPFDTMTQLLHNEPVSPRLLNSKIALDLETICTKCLEKYPQRRYGSAQELADDLDRYLKSKPIEARPISRLARAWRWRRRNPWPSAAAAAVILLAVVTLVWAITLRRQLWQSLYEQARAERLAGDRGRALELIGRAAHMKRSPGLRQEAIQAITSAGLRLRSRIRHDSAAGSGWALSDDGEFLAAVDYLPSSVKAPPVVKVWETSSGRLLGQTNPDWQASFFVLSPKSHIIALFHYPNDAYLWDPMGNREVMRFNGQPICFSSDGAVLAVKNGKETNLIDAARGEPLPLRTEGIPVAFASSEELLVRDLRRLKRWNIHRDEEVSCTPEDEEVLGVSPNGRAAALRKRLPDDARDMLVVRDLPSGREIRSLPELRKKRSNEPLVFFDYDGRLIAFRDPTNLSTLRILDLATGEFKQSIRGILSSIRSWFARPVFNRDGSLLATVGGNHFTRVWEVETGRQVAALRDNVGPVWSCDGRFLVTKRQMWLTPEGGLSMSMPGFLNIWEAAKSIPSYPLRWPVDSLALSQDGKRLASNGCLWDIVKEDGRMRLRRSSQGEKGTRIEFCGADEIWSVVFPRPPGRPPDAGVMRLYQLAPERRKLIIPSPGDPFNAFAFSPDGKFLAFARYKVGGQSPEVIELWDIDSQERLAKWESDWQWRSIRFSSDGKLLACGGNHGVEVWDVAKGERLHQFNLYRSPKERWDWGKLRYEIKGCTMVYSAIFGRGGKKIYAGGDDGDIHIFDIQEGAELSPWEGHQDGVRSLAMSPDGQMLASGSDDQTIRLWDADRGRELARWDAHEGGVAALVFGSDGRTLISGGGEGTVKLWDLPFIRRELSVLGLDW